MKIQLIGHASLLVSTDDCRFLIDPVFVDPHAEGIEEIYPRRAVLIDQLTEFDLLIISHRHFDHFDVATLSRLPKDVPVFIPEDRLMRACLERLGYAHIQQLGIFKEVTLGQTRLLTTGSDGPVQEFGLLVADKSGVFWNQIDSVVNAKTIETILARYGAVDLMLAMWQPMLEFNYQMNRSLEFPYAAYEHLLNTISMLSPSALAPGANGFRYYGASSWLDRVVFPVTREQFCRDVADACPRLRDHVFTLDPGDVIQLHARGTQRAAEMPSFLRRVDVDSEPYRFAPVHLDEHFVDVNTDGYDCARMVTDITREVEETLPEFIRSEAAAFLMFKKWQVVYQLQVAFPNGFRTWTLDFSGEDVVMKNGSDPLANLFSYITASALFSIMNGIKGWDYALLGGFYRMYQKIYKATPLGLVRPTYAEFKDPLALRFDYDSVLEATLLKQVDQLATLERTTA